MRRQPLRPPEHSGFLWGAAPAGPLLTTRFVASEPGLLLN